MSLRALLNSSSHFLASLLIVSSGGVLLRMSLRTGVASVQKSFHSFSSSAIDRPL